MSAPLPEGKRRLGPATIYTGCTDEISSGDEVKFSEGLVFDPKAGKTVAIPTPTVPQGQKLTAQGCTVGGVDKIMVYWVYSVLTPSSGLNPERTVTRIAAFDPFTSGGPTADVEVPAEVASSLAKVLPTDFGFMAGNSSTIHGFDPVTLAPTWHVDGPVGDIVSNNFRGVVAVDPTVRLPGNGVNRYVFYSAQDGAQVGDFIGEVGFGSPFDNRHPRGFTMLDNSTSPSQFRYFDMVTNKLGGPVGNSGVFWDNLRLSWNKNGDDAAYIEVWDKDQNKVIFSRHGKDVTGLNPTNVYLAGKYLYIKNDSDSPVIDITTGEKVSTGWKVRPTDQIGDWTMVANGDVVNNQSQCFAEGPQEDICYDTDDAARALIRSPGGQYPGPWY